MFENALFNYSIAKPGICNTGWLVTTKDETRVFMDEEQFLQYSGKKIAEGCTEVITFNPAEYFTIKEALDHNRRMREKIKGFWQQTPSVN